MWTADVESSRHTWKLAALAATFPFDQVSRQIIDLFPLLILDNVATMLAGVVQPVHRFASQGTSSAVGVGAVEALAGAKLPLSSPHFSMVLLHQPSSSSKSILTATLHLRFFPFCCCWQRSGDCPDASCWRPAS